MNLSRKSFLWVGVIMALLFSSIPTSVLAADLLSVTPTSVVNTADNTITVTGTGFDNTAVVLLGGSALATTFYKGMIYFANPLNFACE